MIGPDDAADGEEHAEAAGRTDVPASSGGNLSLPEIEQSTFPGSSVRSVKGDPAHAVTVATL